VAVELEGGAVEVVVEGALEVEAVVDVLEVAVLAEAGNAYQVTPKSQ
jgi:hypothetical protein